MDGYRGNHFGFRIPMVTLPVACVIQCISVASAYWFNADFVILDIHFGLWKVCVSSPLTPQNECDSMTGSQDWFKATQAVAILAIIIGFFGIVSLYTRNCSQAKNKLLGIFAMISAFTAGLCIIIGVSMFAIKLADLDLSVKTGSTKFDFGTDHLSWSWYLGLAGAISMIKAAIFLTVGVIATSSESSYKQTY